MSAIRVQGTLIDFDPDEIASMEVSSKENPHSVVTISLQGRSEPMTFEFANRKQAIEFCEEIWSQRSSGDE